MSERQRGILQWIADGCPDRPWPDETHKHSARALQNRGLAAVSRVDGRWTARLTEAGRYYLEHGRYPASQAGAEVRQPRRSRVAGVNRAAVSPELEPGPDVQPSVGAPFGPPNPTPAEWLYLRLLQCEGRMQVVDQADGGAAAELLEAGLAPAGKVIKSKRRGWHHRVLYLTDDPEAVVLRREIVVPQRLRSPHPIAKVYQQDRDVHEVSSAHLARAVRIVHALATAFDEAGLPLALRPGRADGQFQVRSGRWGESVKLSEKSAPGGAPVPHYNLRSARRLPAWQARRQKQFIATGKLTIVVGGSYSFYNRQFRFSDTRSHSLEDVLADVVREVEMRLVERGQEDIEKEREELELRQRWEEVLDAAELRAVEAHRAEVLSMRATRWRQWQDQMAYIADLELRLEELPEDERSTATEWVEWSRTTLKELDPFRSRHGMPDAPAPTREFVEPHLRGWAGSSRAFRA